MKKFLILFMAFSLFATACNDNPNPNKRVIDDYGNKDNNNKERNAKDKQEDNPDNNNNDGMRNDDDTWSWSRKDVNDFMNACESDAKKNLSDFRAKEYCECMLSWIKNIFRSYKEASKGLSEMPKERLNEMIAICNEEE